MLVLAKRKMSGIVAEERMFRSKALYMFSVDAESETLLLEAS